MKSRATIGLHLPELDRYQYHVTIDGENRGNMTLDSALAVVEAHKQWEHAANNDRLVAVWMNGWHDRRTSVVCIGYPDSPEKWITKPVAIGTWSEMFPLFEAYARMLT